MFKFEEVFAIGYTWIKLFDTARAIARRTTCCECGSIVIADSFCCFQARLKVVDICSRELCGYVAGGAAEDRIDKVVFLEEHASVVWAFPSVVKRENAWVLVAQKTAACLSTYGVIVMGRIEWNRRSSACAAALVRNTFIRESILVGNPRKVAGELCIRCWVLAVLV